MDGRFLMSNMGRPRQERKEVDRQKCCVCKKSKKASNFFRDKRNITGLRYECKSCHDKRRRASIVHEYLTVEQLKWKPIKEGGNDANRKETNARIRYRNVDIRPKVK